MKSLCKCKVNVAKKELVLFAIGQKKNRGLGGIRRKASTAFCLSNHLCHRNTTLRLQPSDILYQPKTTNLNEP